MSEDLHFVALGPFRFQYRSLSHIVHFRRPSTFTDRPLSQTVHLIRPSTCTGRPLLRFKIDKVDDIEIQEVLRLKSGSIHGHLFLWTVQFSTLVPFTLTRDRPPWTVPLENYLYLRLKYNLGCDACIESNVAHAVFCVCHLWKNFSRWDISLAKWKTILCRW